MQCIHILDESVINKIAAGEVVERPASVVKELVENAIDSGASSLNIEIEDGGLKKISVKDNGSGVYFEDFNLLLKRHATSKISSPNDLFNIHSMGFRGEALSSIASVSKFQFMSSKAKGTGTSLSSLGGAETKIRPWMAHTQGSEVIVADLFFNLPVRLKFLKDPPREFSQINEWCTNLSLTRPDLDIRLTHNQKEKFHYPACLKPLKKGEHYFGEDALKERAQQVLGTELASKLLYNQQESELAHMEALFSPPGYEKLVGKFMVQSVNSRLVKDQLVRFGILRGYYSHLLKGHFPICILRMNVEPALVDVNVHPTKTELRFQYEKELQGQISRLIKDKLKEASWADGINDFHQVKETEDKTRLAPSHWGPIKMPNFSTLKTFISPNFGRKDQLKTPVIKTPITAHSEQQSAQPSSTDTDIEEKRTTSDEPSQDTSKSPNNLVHYTENNSEKESLLGLESLDTHNLEFNLHELEYLGTLFKCYWLFESRHKMVLVDQHAFHERILYEKMHTNQSYFKDQSQGLLVPFSIEIDAEEAHLFLAHKKDFINLGLHGSLVGESTLEITHIPAILMNRDLSTFLHDLFKKHKTDQIEHGLLPHLVATTACHGAIKAGEVLSFEELKILFKEAESVDFYYNCPHGRRVFKTFKKSEVYGWFDRV